MPCPRCHREPPTDAEFCPACGYGVLVASSPRSYTPKHLAEKILTSRSAVQGERKQVTVLFADVSGFTSLSERLDAQEVHWLMNEAFE